MLFKKRVPLWVVLMLSSLSIGLGLLTGLFGADAQPNHYSFVFADGVREFCEIGGQIDIGHREFNGNQSKGFATPEEAVNAYIERLRLAASGGLLPSGHALSQEVYDELAPSRQFEVPARKDISQELIYFDAPSNKPALLEARLVVRWVENGYHISDTYMCESMLVRNAPKFQQDWFQEVKSHENR